MLKHFIFIFIVLFPSILFSQSTDSLVINDSTQTSDSLNFSIVDTTEVPDSLKTFVPVKRDTIVPVQGEPLSDASTIINKRTFLFTNYRYTGDLLRSFSFNFIKDLGFIGQPNETFIYGVGNNGISFLQDGVLWNNRFTNSLDLNLVQSENIDSIEIVRSPRGFLYGPYNNPVTVNFITKDFVSPEPYSRIKYYEGPNGEAMIDGKFNSQIMKRWNLSFQATNRSVDETYINSEFGIWQVNTTLKYFLSNSVNISGSYYFVSSNQGLNGGVDFDSLSQISNDPNTDLYDPAIAPVLYPSRMLDVTQHNFSLRTLAKPFPNSKLDLSVYYRYQLDEYNFIRDSLDLGHNFSNKSFGSVINYLHELNILTFQLLGDYESINNELFMRSDNYTSSNKYDRFSFGGILTARFLNNFIQTSFYYKQNYWGVQGEDRISLNGLGADIILLPVDGQSLYFGYSLRESRSEEDNVPSIEIGTRYGNSQLLLDVKYFNIEHFYESNLEIDPLLQFYTQKVRGLGLTFNFKFWILLLETNTSYYFEIDNMRTDNIPDWQFVGGFYVNDFFFDNNLDLKAGIKFYYKGKTNLAYHNLGSVGSVEPTNKLDFTLAGEIKKVAIFYFIWENLFGNQYYITPYYPMPERNIRFGLAWELFN